MVLDPQDGELKASCRMGEYNCLASVVLIGKRFDGLSRKLLEDLDKEPVGTDLDPVESVSPVSGGAILRVIGRSTESVTRRLQVRMADLSSVLGGCPWERKW